MPQYQEGHGCPRAHCGGRLFRRESVSEEGTTRMLVCHLCARRAGPIECVSPYRSYRVQFRPDVEQALKQEKADGLFRVAGSPPRSGDHSADIDLPPSLRASVRRYRASPH